MKYTAVLLALVALIAVAQGLNLYDQLGASGFVAIQGAIQTLGLASMFNTTATTPKYTLFAPSNEAVQAILGAGLSAEVLIDAVSFHVLSGEIRSSALSNDQVIPDSKNRTIRINIYGSGSTAKYLINGKVMINLTQVDIQADNGIIHGINAVIIPPTAEEQRTITAEVVANPSFTTLEAALIAANLAGTFNTTTPFTVFAPTDAAFNALPAGLIAELLKPANLPTLTSILQYHVVSGTVFSAALSEGMDVRTLYSATVQAKITLAGGAKIDSANITTVDLVRANGAIHVIDKVLVPAGLTLPTVGGPTANPPADTQGSAATAAISMVAVALAAILAF